MSRLRVLFHWRFRLAALLIMGPGGFLSLWKPATQALAAPSDSMTMTIMVPDADPPQAIPDLTATPGSEGQVSLSWTAPDENTASPTGNAVSTYTVRTATFSAQSVGSTTTWWNMALDPAEPEPAPLAPPNPQAMLLNNLEPGATYYFGVLSRDVFNNVSPMDTKSVGLVNQANAAVFDAAPSSPTSFNATPGDGQVSLSWNAVSAGDLDFYRIYVDSTTPYDFGDAFTLTVDSPTTNFNHAGLTNGASYYYRVTVLDKGAPSFAGVALESPPSNTVFAVPASPLPNAPALAYDLAQTTTQQIRWVVTDNATNETELHITTASNTGARLSGNLGPLAGTGGTTGYIDTSLSVNTPYTRYAEAFNVGGSSFSAALTRYTLANPPVGLATAVFTTAGGTLTWNANNNPVGTLYVMDRSTDGVSFAQIAAGISTTSYLDTNLVEGSTYTYRAYAQNGDGVATSTSNAASLTIPRIDPGAITDLTAVSGSEKGSVTLSWTAPGDDGTVGNITSGRYRIDYDQDPAAAHLLDASAFQIDLATNTVVGARQTLLVTGLQQGKVYYFRVYALDEGLNVSVSTSAFAEATKQGDIKSPKISNFSPNSPFSGTLTTGVEPDDAVTVTFDESVEMVSFTNAFRLRAIRDFMGVEINEDVTGAMTSDGVTFTFQPAPALKKNYTYEISISTLVTDLAGNALTAPFRERFRTIFDYSRENVLVAEDGKTCVRIPAGTFEEDGYIRMSLDPMQVSFGALSGVIQDAIDKEKARRGPDRAPLEDSVKEFQLISAKTGQEMGSSLQRPMELCLPYADPDDDGFVEGPSFRIHERFLGVVTLNEDASLWVIVPGAEVDRVNKTLTVRVPHFSVYAIMPVATNFVGDAFAYPVPFVPSEGHTQITFTNLALQTTLRIYSLSGILVRELEENDGDGQLDWNVKNEDGEDVFSGVYFYVIKSGSEKKVGRLMVIR